MASIDVNEVKGLFRVGMTSDREGNPVAALEVLGVPIAYASERDFEMGQLDCEDWQDIFALRLGRFLASVLLDEGDSVKWGPRSPTGQEIRRLHPEDD